MCYVSIRVVYKVLTVLQGSHVPDLPPVNRKAVCELNRQASSISKYTLNSKNTTLHHRLMLNEPLI